MAELSHKTYLLFDLVPVGVICPKEDIKGDGESLPDELYRIISCLFILILFSILDRS